MVKRFFIATMLIVCAASPALAGYGDTLPQNLFMLDVAYLNTTVRFRWDEHGEKKNLVDDIEMYEPTGELQGKLTAPAQNQMDVLLTTLFYGVTDELSIGLIFPLVMVSKTSLNMGWKSGDYNAGLGRPYSERDFWQWADSMGQPKPKDWEGRNLHGDLIIGARYRIYREAGYQLAAMAYVDTRTGVEADPEELGAAGSTGFAMGSNGDLGLFLSFDKYFEEEIWDRFTFSANVFYEFQFRRRLKTPTGKKHPLLLTYSPYVGSHYWVDPYDYYGFQVGFGVDLFIGPDDPTWMTKDDPALQDFLPAMLSIKADWNHRRYTSASDYQSLSPQWDKDQEDLNGCGYRNTLIGRFDLNLMRIGAPLVLYFQYSNQELLQSQNLRPVVSYQSGINLIFTF